MRCCLRIFLATVVLLTPLLPATSVRAIAAKTISVDGAAPGRTFDGVGALSAGASSRLLIDYPEQQRGQILDHLFKPGYGAALQILKVEIGGDTNSTDGAEPSHRRTPQDLNCGRGYEWWLMEQAKRRNPNIKLSALQWGAPGWTGDNSGERPTVWTERNIDYLISWLDCARKRHLKIDYLGGWNEAWYDVAWYKKLAKTLDQRGYADVKVVADDSFWWVLAKPLAEDPEFRDAVDVVGQHYVCGYLSEHYECPSPPEIQQLGKPIHASEQGSLPYDSGAQPLARALNRPYIDGLMTSTINWSLIASWYDTMPFQASGLMGAVEPWSGAYAAGPSLWAVAHTTQFTRPGWRFVDSAKGRLDGGAGSYVALRSDRSGDYSVVVETIDAKQPQEITLEVKGGLSTRPLNVWSSDFTSTDPGRWFVREGTARPGQTVTLQPGRVYSFTTTTGQGKGRAVSPPARPWRLPYRDGFDAYRTGATPRYLSDLDGAFEASACAGRGGKCLRQVITEQPVWWNGWLKKPVTLVGDLKSWRDYLAQVDAKLEQDGWVEVLGRVDGQYQNVVSGVHLRVSANGEWRLYDENLRGQSTDLCLPSDPSCVQSRGPLAAGPKASAAKPSAPQQRTLATGRTAVAPGQWHRLGVGFNGNRITAYLDGKQIAAVDSPVHASGLAGLGVSPWHNAQFDNLRVDPVRTSGPLRYLPAQDLRVTATSFHHGYEARKVIDGSVQSLWHTEWAPYAPLPQAITLDVGRVRRIGQVTYQPRADGNRNGTITRYELAASTDGQTFTPVATGTWAWDYDRKEIPLPNIEARYLRLTAVEAGGGYASAAELQVAVPAQSP